MEKRTRTKNGVANIKSGLLNRIVLMLLPFITRTLLIQVLGSNYLGLNGLFTSILQVAVFPFEIKLNDCKFYFS